MPASPSTFVWYELMTTDMDAAQTFYREVVGWNPQTFGSSGPPYTIMNAADKPAAGVMQLSPEMCEAGARPGWVGYIGVADVDAATERLRKAGGAVHREPDDIPNVGRFAVTADPQGAVFMLFTPAGGDGTPAAAGTPGHVGWRELYASDMPEAFAFYADQFGWTKAEAVDMGPMGVYQLFAAGAETIGGMMNKPPLIPSPVWLFYFTVDGIDAAAARVAGHGGRILNGPHQVPGGSWIVHCMDGQGAMFALTASNR